MGIALTKQGNLDDAIAAFQRTLAIKPDYAEAHNNMGNVFKRLSRLNEAKDAYRRALVIKPDYAEAHNNMGAVLHEQGRLDKAIESYQRALAIKPDFALAEMQMIHLMDHVCDWRSQNLKADTCRRLDISTQAVPPFPMLSCEDNPGRQLLRALKWSAENHLQQAVPLPARPQMRPPRLRIGYFSADFREHATMHLLAGVLRHHDRSKFEIHAFHHGHTRADEVRKRAQRDVDHFHDISDCSDCDIMGLARSQGLDIAIDLDGYTRDSRSRLFQFRLAPIQINYLGYPGTMGTGFIDYIVADPVVISEDQRRHYSEKVISLPNTYQPTDDTCAISGDSLSRGQFGLPDDAFVFCCFNATYKVSPREFDIWMRMLARVDPSVLWLFSSNQWAEQNLRRHAEARGIDPERLVFADKLAHAEHLARHRHANLFIDTFDCNPHTTASDALWAGLPVVTRQGEQFAARVAASLLTAVGLPELIVGSDESYEHLILELATEPVGW
jgi:predicted O-linked N-acetylglucosamine transferase (SPINDLY family)